MPDHPLLIVFFVSIILIAIYMVIEGLVLANNVFVRFVKKRTMPPPTLPPAHPTYRCPPPTLQQQTTPPAPIPAKDAGQVMGISAGNVLEAMASAKPHLLIVGHTGGGKSVLARALVQHLVASKTAKVVALDPDAAPRHYPAAVHLLNDDEQWGKAIASIANMFAIRNEEYREGQERFDAIWIVADECQELLAMEGTLPTIERLIRRGRKLNMHVCLAVQDSQVKTLGLERKSALLENLSRIEVMKRGEERFATVDGKEYPVPPFPTTYDGARGIVLDLEQMPAPPAPRQWTEKHIRAAALLACKPDIGARELARQLYGGNGTGKGFDLAKKIRNEVQSMTNMKGNDDETGD